MAIILPVRQGTPEWLAARENGIGASQAAAAIGLSAWQSPVGLWAEKLGLVPPQAETPSMRIGTALEPLIAAMYTEATGVKIRRANNLRQHPNHPFMLASLDRRAGRKPIELKFSARAVGYGEPGTDEVPDDVLVQVLHQLAVIDEPEGDVALLKPGAGDVLIYPIHRTPEAEAAIVEREAIFWDHVVSRTEPPVDGSEATHRALAAMYPRGADELVLDADEPTARAMRTLRKIRLEQTSVEGQRAKLEAAIQAAMLAIGATIIRAPGVGEIPWRTTKDRETTDWKAVAADLRSSYDLALSLYAAGDPIDVDGVRGWLEDVIPQNTISKPSVPRFGPPRWTEEE